MNTPPMLSSASPAAGMKPFRNVRSTSADSAGSATSVATQARQADAGSIEHAGSVQTGARSSRADQPSRFEETLRARHEARNDPPSAEGGRGEAEQDAARSSAVAGMAVAADGFIQQATAEDDAAEGQVLPARAPMMKVPDDEVAGQPLLQQKRAGAVDPSVATPPGTAFQAVSHVVSGALAGGADSRPAGIGRKQVAHMAAGRAAGVDAAGKSADAPLPDSELAHLDGTRSTHEQGRDAARDRDPGSGRRGAGADGLLREVASRISASSRQTFLPPVRQGMDAVAWSAGLGGLQQMTAFGNAVDASAAMPGSAARQVLQALQDGNLLRGLATTAATGASAVRRLQIQLQPASLGTVTAQLSLVGGRLEISIRVPDQRIAEHLRQGLDQFLQRLRTHDEAMARAHVQLVVDPSLPGAAERQGTGAPTVFHGAHHGPASHHAAGGGSAADGGAAQQGSDSGRARQGQGGTADVSSADAAGTAGNEDATGATGGMAAGVVYL